MLTYWETLTAIQSNVPVNDSYAKLWGRKSRGGYTVTTYTGTLPAVLTGTKVGYLHRYKIYGNTEQIGTPTPENPIVPQECGELETAGVYAGQYKLPLASAGQSVDIYLGDEPLRKIGDYADYIDYGTGKIVRQVRKIELTGNENINKNSGSATNYLFYTPRNTLTDSISKTSIVCDRLRAVSSPPASQIGINTINNYNMVYFNFGADIMNAQPSGNTIDGLKEYLAAQHTAGTPVTVWYVLATPTEEDPPAPFPQIPTSAGSTTISWAGEGLAPSKVELEYEKKR